MDNKFMNLKKEYRDFINETSHKIKDLDIDNNLSKSKCIRIFNLFENINQFIENSSNLNVNDVNHILLNYNRDNENVDLLKETVNILVKNGLANATEIKNKIKKTYKNRYFLIINNI